MSDNRFEEEPDGDPHGECAAEIHALRAQLNAVKHQYDIAEIEHDILRKNDIQERLRRLAAAEIVALRAENLKLYAELHTAEAALADIGDADRNPGEDVAWCEARAAQADVRRRHCQRFVGQ